MATSDFNAQIPLDVEVPPRLLTAADLLQFPTELPSGSVDYELINGRILMMSPAGGRHGLLQLRIGTALQNQGVRPGHGLAWTEGGILLARNPDTVFAPDVSFVGKEKLPLQESAEGYFETIPDLVVEIRSKNDTSTTVALSYMIGWPLVL